MPNSLRRPAECKFHNTKNKYGWKINIILKNKLCVIFSVGVEM
jgi:hypothetical protein